MHHALATYRPLEARIRKCDLGALLARWQFGRKLLAERGDKERLPKGRAEAIARSCGIVITGDNYAAYMNELSRRMRFAEECPTAAQVRAAFKKHGSWHNICAEGLGDRGASGGERGPTLRIDHVDPRDLQPHPRNYRQHTPEQLAHIVRSIDDLGIYRPVVLARGGVILAGHGLVQAALQLEVRRVPVTTLDLDPDDPRALKVLAADNEIANLAYDDDRKLTDMLREIKDALLSDDDRTVPADAADAALLGSGLNAEQLAARVLVSRLRSEIKDFDAAKEWVGAGMPEYVAHGEPCVRMIVSFANEADRERFRAQNGLTVRKKQELTRTWSCWFPDRPRVRPSLVEFAYGGQDEAEEAAAAKRPDLTPGLTYALPEGFVVPQGEGRWLAAELKRNPFQEVRVQPGDVVLDVGACYGTFAAAAMEAGAGRVVCFEPFPPSAAVCASNLRRYGAERHVVDARAVVAGEGDSVVRLELSGFSGAHTIMPGAIKHPRGKVRCIDVPAVGIRSVLATVAPQVVKIDIEGAEYGVLASLQPGDLASVRCLFVEFHRATVHRDAPLHKPEIDAVRAFVRAEGLIETRTRLTGFTWRRAQGNLTGYERAQFVDAFARYL